VVCSLPSNFQETLSKSMSAKKHTVIDLPEDVVVLSVRGVSKKFCRGSDCRPQTADSVGETTDSRLQTLVQWMRISPPLGAQKVCGLQSAVFSLLPFPRVCSLQSELKGLQSSPRRDPGAEQRMIKKRWIICTQQEKCDNARTYPFGPNRRSRQAGLRNCIL